MRFLDLSGQRFGRLTAIRKHGVSAGKTNWQCDCECGNETIVRGTHMTAGRITSCGCVSLEGIARLNRSHGLSKTRVYRIWRNMINRCYFIKRPDYLSWGGRGITVCDRWRRSFEAFYEDMGDAPEWGSIDRIDNNGNYELENCRWATAIQQANNTRKVFNPAKAGIKVPAYEQG